TAVGEHQIPGLEPGVIGVHNTGHGLSAHGAPERHRLRVRGRITHAPAHIRVEGKIQRSQQRLTGAWRRRQFLHGPEVFGYRRALWAACEQDATIDTTRVHLWFPCIRSHCDGAYTPYYIEPPTAAQGRA